MTDGTHNGEFSIVRHHILEDDKFATIYPDKTVLGTWLTLLMAADKAWPSPAAVPRDVTDEALEKLVEVGLVDRLPHDHFVMHGMAAERARRSERYRAAAAASVAARRTNNAERRSNDV